VKEEIVDDDAHLPCFNGRVVSWVSKWREIVTNFIAWVWHCLGFFVVLIMKFEAKEINNWCCYSWSLLKAAMFQMGHPSVLTVLYILI
jgi:hypothetical protein